MNLQQLQTRFHHPIHSIIHSCIESVVHNTQLRTSSAREPDYVAQLVFDLPTTVNDQIAPLLAKSATIASSAVFVHQSPLVHCTSFPEASPRSVEIGDLLLIISYRQKPVARWALLLQAKISRTPDPLRPDNANQHHLYCYWPPFEYSRGIPQTQTRSRHVCGPQLYQGSQYLLIDTTPSKDVHLHTLGRDTSAIVAHPSQPLLSRLDYAGTHFFHLLFGHAGRPFQYPPSTRDYGWSRVITDLIEVTARRVSRVLSGTRGRGMMFCVAAVPSILAARIERAHMQGFVAARSKEMRLFHYSSENLPPIEDVQAADTLDDDGGISIIEITIDEGEEELLGHAS